MNSSASTRILPRSARANFSPIGRAVSVRSAERIRSERQSAPSASQLVVANSISGEQLISRLWDPGLLDRLQAPLTHYHD